jgi:hypothetical protein
MSEKPVNLPVGALRELAGALVGRLIVGPPINTTLINRLKTLPEEIVDQAIRYIPRQIQITYLGRAKEWYNTQQINLVGDFPNLDFIPECPITLAGGKPNDNEDIKAGCTSSRLQYIEEYDLQSGKKHGLSRWWYENGRPMSVESWNMGLRVGERKMWSNTGQLLCHEQYNDKGQLHGQCNWWYRNGAPHKKIMYENGKDVGGKVWNVLGEITRSK